MLRDKSSFQDFFGFIQFLSRQEKMQQYLFSLDSSQLYALQFFNEDKQKWVYACPMENMDEERRYQYICMSLNEASEYMSKKLDTGKLLRVVKISRYLPDSTDIQIKEILYTNF